MTPWHILSQATIFMRLLAPHLSTTSPINDHPRPLLGWQQPPRRLSMMIACHLANDSLLAISTRPLHRPTVACPGELQIFDLALILIVEICPQFNHIKLDEHTRRQNLSPSVSVARSKLFLFLLLFLNVTTLITRPRSSCICTQADRSKHTNGPRLGLGYIRT
jgi:hypothetical protein